VSTERTVTFPIANRMFGRDSIAKRLNARVRDGQIHDWHRRRWIDWGHPAIPIRRTPLSRKRYTLSHSQVAIPKTGCDLTQDKLERAITAGETAGERHQCSTARANEMLPYNAGRDDGCDRLAARRLASRAQPEIRRSESTETQMAAKEVCFSTDARERMLRGVDILSNAVKITLGPKGRNVIIDKSYGASHTTKDGVTVAKEIGSESSRTQVCGAATWCVNNSGLTQGELR